MIYQCLIYHSFFFFLQNLQATPGTWIRHVEIGWGWISYQFHLAGTKILKRLLVRDVFSIVYNNWFVSHCIMGASKRTRKSFWSGRKWCSLAGFTERSNIDIKYLLRLKEIPDGNNGAYHILSYRSILFLLSGSDKNPKSILKR